MVVDDALKGRAEADSDTIRGNLHEWWSSVARTRLAPGAPVNVTATRWHEDDLPGRMAGEGWPVVNIPALADGKTLDALARPTGEWMRSARGRTVADWEKTRADVGEREFAALFQGRPAPLEGGVFRSAWFDMHRAAEPPGGLLPPMVVVDPADNEGTGDEAGILVGAKHPATNTGYVLADLSGHLTAAQWVRRALLACVEFEAPTLAYEQSLSGLRRRVREGWDELWREAMALRAEVRGEWPATFDPAVIGRAEVAVSRPSDGAEARTALGVALIGLWPHVPGVLRMGESGPQVRTVVARGSKTLRMQLVAPAFETGRVRLVGRFPALEHCAVTWQVGQDSPDRVDCLVHLAGLLTGQVEGRVAAAQGQVPTRSTRSVAAGGVIVRSTRMGGRR
jgi:hypothetical protein